MNDNDLTNLHGLKRALHLPYSWLRREALAGRLPCLKVGRQLRFNVQAVRAALANRAKGKEAAPDRPGEPESIGEILPRVLADLDRRRRKLKPDQLALLDDDVRELAPIMEDTDDER
jgi:hypothetical protein